MVKKSCPKWPFFDFFRKSAKIAIFNMIFSPFRPKSNVFFESRGIFRTYFWRSFRFFCWLWALIWATQKFFWKKKIFLKKKIFFEKKNFRKKKFSKKKISDKKFSEIFFSRKFFFRKFFFGKIMFRQNSGVEKIFSPKMDLWT